MAGLEDRPEAKNLITIFAALSDQTPDQVCAEFGGQQFSVFKPALADLLIQQLSPIREKMKEFMADQGELDNILRSHAARANEIAAQNMSEVRDMMGLLQV